MRVHVAIPVLDEPETIFRCLGSLGMAEEQDFTVWICVNQPDAWWADEVRRPVCERNASTLEKLIRFGEFPIRLLDRSSPGMGWTGISGVGQARRELMDEIAACADDTDIIASLDADTLVSPGYVGAVREAFERFPAATGLSLPYLHRLGPDGLLNRAILRYESYLRHHALHLWRVGSPYAFTALGSAMAFPVGAYRRAGGMPVRRGGEDFYMLQKLVKLGPVVHWASCRVYPDVRLSSRVGFGTGPALTRGVEGDWGSYPMTAPRYFDDVGMTIQSFPHLYRHGVETPLSPFLQERLRTEDPWESLRRNHREEGRFVRACHERLDGLRTFQYLRTRARRDTGRDEENLAQGLRKVPEKVALAALDGSDELQEIFRAIKGETHPSWTFGYSPVEFLDSVRQILRLIEEDYRRAWVAEVAARV